MKNHSFQLFSTVKDDVQWDKYLKYLLIFGFFFLMFLAYNTSINGDEDVQEKYSLSLFNWYTSGGTDQSYLTSIKGDAIRYYGGFFELVSVGINKVMGYSLDDAGFHTSRHFLVAIFGFFILFFAGKIGRLLSGPKLGFLIVLLLLVSPRFVGHAVMNPKDIPFALGYIMSLYYMLKWIKEELVFNKNIIFGLVLGLMIAIGSRINGVLLYFYWGLMLLSVLISNKDYKNLKDKKVLYKYLLAGLTPLVLGLFFAYLVWPYGLIAPIEHTKEALDAFAKFAVGIKSLFNGQLTWSTEIPLKYLGTWMLISIPIIVLLGVVLFMVFIKKILKSYGILGPLMLAFSFVFPFLYVLVKGSALYDGWRHFNFIYVPLAIVSAMGLMMLLDYKNKLKYVVYAVLLVGVLEPAFHIVKNYKIPYVYFNPLVGGTKGALGEFEQDYWGISVRQGFEWLNDNGYLKKVDKDIIVGSNFWYAAKCNAINYPGVKHRYIKLRQRYDKDWDYAILVGRFIDPGQLKSGYWPPKNALHTIRVNGAPVAVIYKKDQNMRDALNAKQSNDINTAMQKFLMVVKENPDNDIAWVNIGDIYTQSKDYPKAEKAYSECLRINPDDLRATIGLGINQLNLHKMNAAKMIFINALKNTENPYFYYYLGLIAQKENDNFKAIDFIKKAIKLNPRFGQAYQLGAQIYQDMGDNNSAQRYLSYLQQLRK